MEGFPSQIQVVLDRLAQCAQPALMKSIELSGCGADISCICKDSEIYAFFRGSLLLTCDSTNQTSSLDEIKNLCISVAPSLKDDRGIDVIATTTVVMILATIAVVLRFVSRHISAAKVGMDDYLILIALLFSYGEDIDSMLAVPRGGYGKHLITVSPSKATSFAKAYLGTQTLFAVAITAIKLSILFFYRRVFPFRRFTVASIIIGCISIAWFLALILTSFLGCRPFRYTWDKSIADGHCLNQNVLGYGITGTNVLTDIAVLVLPIPWLWNLHMQTSRKLAIIGIFLIGSFVCIASIVRVPLIVELKETDITYTIVTAGIWINVECNIGIVSACLPVMRPLLNTAIPKLIRSRFYRSHSSRTGGKGSHRLADEELGTDGTHVGTVDSTAEALGGKLYKQQPPQTGKHKTWLSAAFSSQGGGNGMSLEEEMVPVGKIAIRHDVEWQEGDVVSPIR